MSPERQNPLILIVDDDPDARAMLISAFEPEQLTCLPAADGAAALALCEKVTPDLIVMDAVMPGISGFDACRALKAHANLAHVPVIFMTGLTETEHVVMGLSAGGVDYVTKPIVLDELLARVRVHLANARATHTARLALDAAGRSLLTTSARGRLLWCTPQAADLLELTEARDPEDPARLVPALAAALTDLIARPDARGSVTLALGGRKLGLVHLGQTAQDEFFFRIFEERPGREQEALRSALGLTSREADVLLWISRGKSNRDASEILNISPRTVNKHLEQIFEKLSVENRAAAAAVATRIIAASS